MIERVALALLRAVSEQEETRSTDAMSCIDFIS